VENDWISVLVANKKMELEEKRFKAEKDLSDRKMLDAHSDAMWSEVWDTTEKAVEEYNERMENHCISFHANPSQNKFSLRVRTQDTDIRFDRQRWIISSPHDVYTLTIAEGNEVVWKKSGSTKRTSGMYTSAQVAQEQFTKVLRQS
jgi:hypothetical protein